MLQSSNSNPSVSSPELNNHHNALRQVTLEGSGHSIAGFSISGLSSYIQVPELDLCFDMGECPLSAISLNHVFLTHAHGDHSRCLMRHDSLRKMINIERPAAYYIPEPIYEGAVQWVRAEAAFEGVSDARFHLPHLISVPADRWLPMEYRPDLLFKAFPVKHTLPSQGFTVALHKKKLKDEYLGLPSSAIISLRKQGIDITREVIEPKVTYIGDCIGDSLFEQAHIWQSEQLILECTFLDDDEITMARKKGHTHIQEIAKALEEFGSQMACQRIVLKHFSMKYSRKHILHRVQKRLPPQYQDRIVCLV